MSFAKFTVILTNGDETHLMINSDHVMFVSPTGANNSSVMMSDGSTIAVKAKPEEIIEKFKTSA